MLLVKDLQMHRSDRLAQLQTPFPIVHWIILSTLGGSILLSFLFETDSAVLQFLDDLQLRYLWTVRPDTYSEYYSCMARAHTLLFALLFYSSRPSMDAATQSL